MSNSPIAFIAPDGWKYVSKNYDETFIEIFGQYKDLVHISQDHNETDQATVQQIVGDMYCGLDDMINDTRVPTMIKIALQYAHEKNPLFNEYIFRDSSYIELDISSGSIIYLKLSSLSIVLYGHTWFEKHFNATLIDENEHKLYRKRITFLTDPSKKMEFRQFCKNFNDINKTIENIIENYYNLTETYLEFFNILPKNILYDNFLSGLTWFLEDNIGTNFIINNWKINIDKMPKIEFLTKLINYETISTFQQCGKNTSSYARISNSRFIF